MGTLSHLMSPQINDLHVIRGHEGSDRPRILRKILPKTADHQKKAGTMSDMQKNQVETTRRYLANKKAKGQRRVTVIVPEERVEELKEYAKKLREEAAK